MSPLKKSINTLNRCIYSRDSCADCETENHRNDILPPGFNQTQILLAKFNEDNLDGSGDCRIWEPQCWWTANKSRRRAAWNTQSKGIIIDPGSSVVMTLDRLLKDPLKNQLLKHTQKEVRLKISQGNRLLWNKEEQNYENVILRQENGWFVLVHGFKAIR